MYDADLLEYIAHSTGGLYFDRDSLLEACLCTTPPFTLSDDFHPSLTSNLTASTINAHVMVSNKFTTTPTLVALELIVTSNASTLKAELADSETDADSVARIKGLPLLVEWLGILRLFKS